MPRFYGYISIWRYRDVFPAWFGDMKMTGDAQAYWMLHESLRQSILFLIEFGAQWKK